MALFIAKLYERCEQCGFSVNGSMKGISLCE